MLMVHALSRGLNLSDFHELSVGMILDYIDVYDRLFNDKKNTDIAKQAGQNEFNDF